MPLLDALRDDLALHGPRFGCGPSFRGMGVSWQLGMQRDRGLSR